MPHNYEIVLTDTRGAVLQTIAFEATGLMEAIDKGRLTAGPQIMGDPRVVAITIRLVNTKT